MPVKIGNVKFSNYQLRRLITLYRSTPQLWNKKLLNGNVVQQRSDRDLLIQTNINHLAHPQLTSIDQWCKVIRHLRDRYHKEAKKMKNGERVVWPFFQSLQFLADAKNVCQTDVKIQKKMKLRKKLLVKPYDSKVDKSNINTFATITFTDNEMNRLLKLYRECAPLWNVDHEQYNSCKERRQLADQLVNRFQHPKVTNSSILFEIIKKIKRKYRNILISKMNGLPGIDWPYFHMIHSFLGRFVTIKGIPGDEICETVEQMSDKQITSFDSNISDCQIIDQFDEDNKCLNVEKKNSSYRLSTNILPSSSSLEPYVPTYLCKNCFAPFSNLANSFHFFLDYLHQKMLSMEEIDACQLECSLLEWLNDSVHKS